MREAFRIGLLRFLALLALNIFIYSAFTVIRSIIFGDDGGAVAIILYSAVILTGSLMLKLLKNDEHQVYKNIAEIPAVKMLAFTFNITEKTRFIASLAIYASLVLPVVETYIVFGNKGLLRTIFEILVTLLPYLILIRHRYSSFSRILHNSISTTGFLILAAAIELSILIGRIMQLKPYLFAAGYVYMFLFLIIKNQEDIDDNIYDRKHIEKSILPRNMRSFNTLAIVVLYSVILILFNLKPVVLWLINLVGRITILFAGFLLWLSSLIFPNNPNQPGENSQQPGLGFTGGGDNMVHPISNFMFNVVMYFTLLYLAYRLVFFLYRRIPSIVGRIIKILGRLFSWDRNKDSHQLLDYDDETEIIKPQKERDRRNTLKTLIKNAGRNLNTITDPVERVRYIYATVLGLLGANGIQTERSDTTLDILRKARDIQGIEKPLNEVTEVYNGVRYGSRIPGKDELSETEARYLETVKIIGDHYF